MPKSVLIICDKTPEPFGLYIFFFSFFERENVYIRYNRCGDIECGRRFKFNKSTIKYYVIVDGVNSTVPYEKAIDCVEQRKKKETQTHRVLK